MVNRPVLAKSAAAAAMVGWWCSAVFVRSCLLDVFLAKGTDTLLPCPTLCVLCWVTGLMLTPLTANCYTLHSPAL